MTWSLSFKSPWLLLFLLVLPVVAGLYVWLDRRRAGRATRWSNPALLENMVVGAPGARRYVPVTLFGVALLLLLLGFGRPESKFREAKDGATIVLMVDISGSMASNDVKPTRLLAADAALTAFVNKLPSKYRAALIVFSNHIAVTAAPTYDRQALIANLPKKTELEGTAMGDALTDAVTVAKKAVGPSTPGKPHPPATILLISDGGSNAGRVQPAAAAAAARKAAIPISTVAIGTATGKVTQIIKNGKTSFPLVQQAPVDPTTLKSVAKASGGKFYAARSPQQLSQVYKALGTRLVYTRQYREITMWVTAAALVLILVGAGLSAWWFQRLV